jgi:phosphatidate phosphatase LPIN
MMDALAGWRDAALLQRAVEVTSTSPRLFEEEKTSLSPLPHSSDEQAYDRQHHRSKSEPPENPPGERPSSWVQWWSRGRRGKPTLSPESDASGQGTNDSENEAQRPATRGVSLVSSPDVSLYTAIYTQLS